MCKSPTPSVTKGVYKRQTSLAVKSVNMSVLNQSGEEQVECPLCMEPLEVDDLNFFPCTCGYQICRFCWHRIRTDENGLCPACRKAYPENPADFKPLSQEEVARLKAEKRHKDQQRKQKITENRKHLANVRVVQRNLVFVVGLPMRLADAEVLKKHEYFGKFGKIHKVVINQSTSYAGSQGPSASAYVTYHKADDALRAIQAVNNISVDGRTIKTSLGTTKYCSHFMKNQACPKPDCMYLHDLGDAEASFTKEEMQQGKHQEYEKKLHEQLLNTFNHRDRKPTPSPPAVSTSISNCQNVYQGSNSSSSSSSTTCIQSCNKEAWPSLQPGLVNSNNNNGNNFGISSGGNGNSSNNNNNNNSNNSSNNNNNNSKNESSQRRQRFDQQSTKVASNHKKRHTSGEESRGKAKEKLQTSLQDESAHIKMQHSSSRSISLSSHDLHQSLQHSSRLPNNCSSSSSSEMTVEAESDIQENDDSCSNGRQQLGGRILPTNHRATLFEPDNNSFFSTNNFTKVAATPSGSATEWPINGLTLTHMPDVLPPVHSSEDWQAAFGFSNSTISQNSQHQDNSCIVIPSDSQQVQPSSEVEGGNAKHGFDSNDQQQSQNFKDGVENKSATLVENICTSFPPPASDLSEDFRVNTSGSGHLSQKIGTSSSFGAEEMVSTGNLASNSMQQVFPHMHQEATVLMMHQHQFPVGLMNHLARSNGLAPSQATSKFLADFHLRQQQSQNLMKQLNSQSQAHSQHLRNRSAVLESGNLIGRNTSNLTTVPSVGGKFSVLGSSDFGNPMGKGGRECKVNSENKLQNGGDIVDGDLVVLEEENYHPGFLECQQKNIDSSIELECKSRDGSSENLIPATIDNNDETVTKDNGRLTDDELGFDPFHETQKALAEMMEKESLQNKQQHLYQQYQLNQMNQFNHQVLSGSKLLSSFTNCSQQHILPQQNHRLAPNVSGCTKLLDGLGLGTMGPPTPTRTRLPPPGFTTAPNHMNAFGLGIPRAPSSNSSKILPFMGLGNNPNTSNNGSASPIPQPMSSISNNSQQGTNPQSILFSSNGSHSNSNSHPYALQNGGVAKSPGESFTVKEWPENLRSLLPTLSSGQSVPFAGTNTPPPPPGSINAVFGAPHTSLHGNTQKGWSGVGPCTDWTALDPAIVSSSRPHNFLAATPGVHLLHHSSNSLLQPAEQSSANPQAMPHLHQLQQSSSGHWLRPLSSEENSCMFYAGSTDWAAGSNGQQNHIVGSPNSGSIMMAPPPPGFSSMRLAAMQQGTATANCIQKKQNTEMGKIEISEVTQTEGVILQNKEEERMEDLR
ncbi:probable serine/threonine-protein kinase DDB_G0267686 isoform X2 [Periplaneta americana]|uniref:probable serine/threonine-protein kinase DDB_G0267686 isoform X2 n=1 Tax=Periplaneta americana TaxID=6978 RepID=UPI0037E91587